MLKSTILGNVLGKNYKPSNEDNIQTTPVGSSGDAVVEIERLKSENLDLMEIHALEQDLALIEAEGEVADELSEATSEITEIKAEIESYYEKGGMSATDAYHIGKRLGYINRRLGGHLNLNIPATESFRGNDADRMTLTASVEASVIDKIKELWNAFIKMIKDVFEKIKNFFGFGKKKAEDAKKKLDEKADENEKKDGKATLALPAPAATAAAGADKPEDIVVPASTSTSEGNESKATAKEGMEVTIVEGLEKLARSTASFLSKVNYAELVKGLKPIMDKGLGNIDSKNNIFGEDVHTYLGIICKSYTGKDLPKASSDEWNEKSEVLYGGYVITMSAKSENSGNKYKVPTLSTSLDIVGGTDSPVKTLSIENVECRKYAKAARALSVAMSNVQEHLAGGEKALNEYLDLLKLAEEEMAKGDKAYANYAFAFLKFAGKAIQDHPVKKYCTSMIDQAIKFSSSLSHVK